MSRKARKELLLYKKLLDPVLSPEERKERKKRDAKIALLQKIKDADKDRQNGFFYLLGKPVDVRQPIESEGFINRRFHAHHQGPVHFSQLDHSETFLWTFALDGVRVWNYNTIALVDFYALPCRYHRNVTAALSTTHDPQGEATVVAMCCQQADMYVFQFKAEKIILCKDAQDLRHGHQGVITHCTFNSAGTLAATCSFDSTIILWHVQSWCMLNILPAHPFGVSHCSFSHDGQYLVSCGEHHCPEIKVWDLRRLIPHTHSVGEQAAGFDRQCRDYLNKAMPCIYSPELTLAAQTTGVCTRALPETQAWSKNRFYSTPLIVPPREDQAPVYPIPALFPPKDDDDDDDHHHHSVPGTNHFNIEEDLDLHYEPPEMDLTKILNPAAETDDPLLVEVPSIDYRLHPEEDYLVHTFPHSDFGTGHMDRIHCCCFSHSKEWLASCSATGEIKIWNVKDGSCARTIDSGHSGGIVDASWSPDDQGFVTGSIDGTLKIWKVSRWTCQFHLCGHVDSVLSVSYTRDGTRVLSSAGDHQTIVWTVRPIVPDQPKVIEIEEVQAHSMVLKWKEPLANGSPLLYYELRTSESKGPFERPCKISKHKNMMKVDKLEAGTTYEFVISAVNEVGYSPFSEPSPVVETLSFAPSKLIKPCDVTDVTTTSVKCTWMPARRNGSDISNYHMHCIPEGGDVDLVQEAARLEKIVPLDTVASEISRGLDIEAALKQKQQQARDEKLKLSGRPKKFPSSSSLSSSLTYQQQLERRQRVKNRQALASATAQAQTLGISQVRVKQEEESQEPLEYTFTGLLPGTVYQMLIAAENRHGIADFSSQSCYFRTKSTAPDIPQAPDIVQINVHDIVIEWARPRENGAYIAQYIVQWEHVGEIHSEIILRDSLPAQPRYTISSLQAGQMFRVCIAAANVIKDKVCKSAFSSYCEPVKMREDRPDPCSACILLERLPYGLRIGFSAPRDNGQPILKYHLTILLQNRKFNVLQTTLVREMEWSRHDLKYDAGLYRTFVPNLEGDRSYCFQLCASNAIGTSSVGASSVAMKTLRAIPPQDIPSPVIQQVLPRSITIHWTAPQHFGGAPLFHYIVEYKTKTDKTWANSILHSEAPPLTIMNLNTKVSYCFRIASVNRAGSSAYSPATEWITTPSLAEYTIIEYYNSRPETEEKAASQIQRLYRRHHARHRLCESHDIEAQSDV